MSEEIEPNRTSLFDGTSISSVGVDGAVHGYVNLKDSWRGSLTGIRLRIVDQEEGRGEVLLFPLWRFGCGWLGGSARFGPAKSQTAFF